MKTKLQALFVIAFFLLATPPIIAQLFIDNSYTAEEMVTDFFDNSCVTPTNIVYTGSIQSMAYFDAGNTDLEIPAGILFSSGDVFSAVGPNTQSSTSGTMGEEGDPDLESLAMGFQSYDASVIEFDIVATGDQLDFSYIFASEEYPEFVSTGFNDVFAFFVSGPGIIGQENIAMVPNTPDPVTINTINDLTNAQYYVDNLNGQDIEFDGFTTELTASITVTPNETYHVKIAISDIGDSVFDSGIFLGIASLCGEELLVPPAQGNVVVNGSTISFENTSKYATSYLWDFGDNVMSTEKTPAPHTYAADGIYEVKLITQNYCCSDTLSMEVTIGNPTSSTDLEVKPFSFSPNPVNDFAKIAFDNGAAFEMKIYDASGKIIEQGKGNGFLELELSAYSSGIYIIEVLSDGKTYRDKFLKL